MAIVESLLTAEQFLQLPESGGATELVRGRIIQMSPSNPRHGELCGLISWFVMDCVFRRGIGRCFTNDLGIFTERNPDTVRGADVAYYSYARLPKGQVPTSFTDIAPEVVFEVRSPSDRAAGVLAKVAEYLNLGVGTVCVVDDVRKTIQVHSTNGVIRVLTVDDVLILPEIHADFQMPLRELFE